MVVKLKQAKRYLTESFFVPDGVTAYEENDVIAAVKYLEGYAVSMRRPLVICMGIGTNMGNHEGQSLLAEYLNSVATRRSRSVVVCGGDEGNSAHHFIGYATAGMKQSTENVEIRVGKRICGRALGNHAGDTCHIDPGTGWRDNRSGRF